MRTSRPFHSLSPQKYIGRRYAPLIVTVVDDEVEKLFKLCGLTFTDFFAAIACKMKEPMRVVDSASICQESGDVFFESVATTVMLYSQSFVFPEYEESSTTDPDLTPYPGNFPSSFRYPTKESMNPPWFRTMVDLLLGSFVYSDFDFADFPACVVYASISGCQPKRIDDVRKMINLPKWMGEFSKEIPIVRVVVYDGLVVSKKPDDACGQRGAFAEVFGLCVRTRRLDSPDAIDPVTIRNLFEYDDALRANKSFCAYLSPEDLRAAETCLQEIMKLVKSKVEMAIRTNEFECEQKKFGSRMKGLFQKKTPERVSDHMLVPWKKIVCLRLGGLYMNTRQYENARKYYKMVPSTGRDEKFPELRAFALFMAALASVMLPNGMAAFKDGITDLIHNIQQAKSIRFLLMVPVISMEFHADAQEFDVAVARCAGVIGHIGRLWSGNVVMRALFLSLFYERMSGLTMEPRRAVLHTARAGMFYQMADQGPHALRCLIWVYGCLPKDSWTILAQNAWYEKARMLLNLKQWVRGLINCKDLLALPNLDWSLHEKVVSLFWMPYNESGLPKDQLQVRVNSLLEVRSLKLTDRSTPQFWGFKRGDFDDVLVEFTNWYKREMSKSKSVGFESWLTGTGNTREEVSTIGIGAHVIMNIGLYNRYKFSVHLDRAVLRADYEGDAGDDVKKYDIEEVMGKDIPGMSSSTSHLLFKIVPLVAGRFTVKTFEKNYWGYVDTEIECGPLVFDAVQDFPSVSMEIANLPNKVYASQCEEFEVVVTNTGACTVSGLALGWNLRNAIVARDGGDADYEGIGVLRMHHTLEPGESHRVSMMFMANRASHVVIRFVASANGIKCAFVAHEVDVVAALNINNISIAKVDDSFSTTYHCSVTSCVDGLEVVGLMTRNRRLVKSMMVEPGMKLAVGCTLAFIGFTGDETGEEMEPWRTALMGSSSLALIYRIEGVKLLFQRNLNFKPRKASHRIHLTVKESRISVNERGEVTVKLLSAETGSTFYIAPSNFTLVDGSTAKSAPVESKPYCCAWVGVTRRVLTDENRHSATFRFKATRPGVYELRSFCINVTPEFTTAERVPVIAHIRVSA